MSKRMTESQTIAILKEAEAGIPAKDPCCKYGIANSTCYKWGGSVVAWKRQM